jgi:spoIIIJ-associated protein
MAHATLPQHAEKDASTGRSEAAAADVACEVLQELLAKCRFRAKVKTDEHDERVELTVVGPDASMLVGKKGQTLDAVQYLVNRIVGRRLGEHKPVSVDADGYRERREASLVELAKRLSEKAQQEGKIVALNPMSARDRRVVHLTLRDTPGISTRSEGQGEERRLLIVPESV